MRLTGNPEGRPKRPGGRRQTVLARVRFFEDTDALTTVRFYGVPVDRPVLPFPSFVANEAWHNDNGPLSNMLYGQAGTQGTQADPHVRYESHDPRDEYNPHHLCGTPDQWAGHMRVDRSADIGDLNCCLTPDLRPTTACACATATMAQGSVAAACVCATATMVRMACACATGTFAQGEPINACACGIASIPQGEPIPSCACSTATESQGEPATACSCSTATSAQGEPLMQCACSTVTLAEGSGGSLACIAAGQNNTLHMSVTPALPTAPGPFTFTRTTGNWLYTGAMGNQAGTSGTLSCAGGGAGWHLSLSGFGHTFNADADSGIGSVPVDTTYTNADMTFWGGSATSTIRIYT